MVRTLILMQTVTLALVPLAGTVAHGAAAGSYLAISQRPLSALDAPDVVWSGLGGSHLGLVHGVPDAMRAAGLVPILDMQRILALCGAGGAQ